MKISLQNLKQIFVFSSFFSSLFREYFLCRIVTSIASEYHWIIYNIDICLNWDALRTPGEISQFEPSNGFNLKAFKLKHPTNKAMQGRTMIALALIATLV